MSRPIKFRAWVVDDRIMDYEPSVGAPDSLNNVFTSNNVEWMQFTGLTDKNGVEIYEGDWIDTKNGSHFVIVWDEENACFKACGNDIRFKGAWVHPVDGVGPREEWEVNGNTYENEG